MPVIRRRAMPLLFALATVLGACSTDDPNSAEPVAPGVAHPLAARAGADIRILDRGTVERGSWILRAEPSTLAPEACFSVEIEWVRPASSEGGGGVCVALVRTLEPEEVEVLTDHDGRGDVLIGVAAPGVTSVQVVYADEPRRGPSTKEDVWPAASSEGRGQPTERLVSTIPLDPWMEARAFAVVLPRMTTVIGVTAASSPTGDAD